MFLIARTREKAKRRQRRSLHARRPGFTDRSIHRRTKYCRATGLTAESLSIWLISLAELTNQYIQSHQLLHQVSYAHLQATPLQRPTRWSKPYSQAPSTASPLPQRVFYETTNCLIVGKLVSFLSVYTNIGSSSFLSHSFFAILRVCDFYLFSYQGLRIWKL